MEESLEVYLTKIIFKKWFLCHIHVCLECFEMGFTHIHAKECEIKSA